MDTEKLAAILETVKVMPLCPDDVILFRVSNPISDDVARRIKEHLQPMFGDRKILVMGPDVDIEIIRPDQRAA